MLWLRLFLPFAGAYFLSYLYRTANAVIGPVLSDELTLGAGDLGLLTSACFLAFAAAQHAAGHAARPFPGTPGGVGAPPDRRRRCRHLRHGPGNLRAGRRARTDRPRRIRLPDGRVQGFFAELSGRATGFADRLDHDSGRTRSAGGDGTAGSGTATDRLAGDIHRPRRADVGRRRLAVRQCPGRAGDRPAGKPRDTVG